MPKRISRAYLTAACCSGYFVMGLIMSLIGAALDVFGHQLSSTPTAVGSAFFFATGSATFVLPFFLGPLIDRFGQKPVMAGGSILCGVAMLFLSQVESLLPASIIMFFIGSGSAGMNVSANTLINHLYPEESGRALNLVNIFFGVGAFSLPLLAGWLFLHMGLYELLLVVSCLSFIPAIMIVIGVLPPGVRVSKFSLREAGQALSDRLVFFFALLIFFYVGLEASLGIWSRLAMVEKWKVTNPQDQLILAGYWASLMIGRFLAGTVFRNLPSHRLVLLCTAGSCLGLAGFLLAPNMEAASAAIWFSGLCFAPIFPSTLGSVGSCFKSYFGTIFSLIIASGAVGSVILSTTVGNLGSSGSLAEGFKLIFAVGLVMLATQIAITLKIRKRLENI